MVSDDVVSVTEQNGNWVFAPESPTAGLIFYPGGKVENKDFFLIRDACHTELEPEEFDENGDGMTLTCIGFRPLPDEIAHQISHKFHLY